MLRLLSIPRVILSRSFNRCSLFLRQTYLSENALYLSSTAAAKLTSAKLPQSSFASDIERIGLRRYLDMHRTSCLLLSYEDRLASFDALWNELKRSNPDMKLINKYLFTKLDCDLPLDFESTIAELKTMGLSPDVRTYGVFINRSCSKGDMDQTNVYLQAMQAADMVPDAYVFSRILYGYAKAGCPEEVASTKEIIAQLSLWPSRIAYEGLLQAYAEMGDRPQLVNLLNEAWDVLGKSQRIADKIGSSDLPFTTEFLIKIYVRQLLAESDLNSTFPELLSRLPSRLDLVGQTRARESIKVLLFHGRLQGALDLFRRVDPETSDDPYLVSVAKYVLARDPSDESTMEQIWSLADVSGSRLSMLRHKAEQVPRKSGQWATESETRLYRLSDAAAIFKTVGEMSNPQSASRLIYNHAVPRLLQLGLSPDEIVRQIGFDALKPSAALGCVLASLSNPSLWAGNDKLAEFVQRMSAEGVFPFAGFVNLRSGLRHAIITTAVQQLPATNAHAALVGRLSHVVNTLEQVLDRQHTKMVCHQLLEWVTGLRPEQPVAGVTLIEQRPAVESIINGLVDVFNAKNIKYLRNGWIFYALENFGISRDRLDSVGFPQSTRVRPEQGAESRSGLAAPLPNRIRGLLRDGKVDEAISLIGQQGRSTDSEASGGPEKRPDTFEFTHRPAFTADPVTIACDLMRPRDKGFGGKTPSSPAVIKLTPEQLEGIFWASWDSVQLNNVPRAIEQVASYYVKTRDLEGMSGFYQRAAGRLFGCHEVLLNPTLIQPLLEHNLTENLATLQSMIGRHLPSLAKFAQSTCHVEQVLKRLSASPSFVEKLNGEDKRLLEQWINPQSNDYWPLQALSERLEGFSHLHRLRVVHLAIDDLCKTSSLQTCHALRRWATRLGLLLLPKTVELLVMTPHIRQGRDNPRLLGPWAMCHELTQHWPVNLSAQQLKSLDGLVRVPLEGGGAGAGPFSLGPIVEATAAWLAKLLMTGPVASASSQHSLPTWLVVSQRLQQTDSVFTEPGNWRPLVSRWLHAVEASGGNGDYQVEQLSQWLPCAPCAPEYRNAMLLACLSAGQGHQKVRDWAISYVRENEDHLYGILTSSDSASLPSELYANYVQAMSELGHKDTMKLASIFGAETLDVHQIEEVLKSIMVSTEKGDGLAWTRQLANLVAANSQLFLPMAGYLKEHHPDSLVAFYDHMFDVLSRANRRLQFASRCYDMMQEQDLSLDCLSPQNQAFLSAASRTLRLPAMGYELPLDQFQRLHGGKLNASWIQDLQLALRRQDFVTVLVLLQSLDAGLAEEALRCVIYNMVGVGETSRLNKLLLVLAENTSDERLLGIACLYSRPFISTGLVDAYAAVADHYSGKEINWISRSTARYHKLGACLRPKAASVGVNRTTDPDRERTKGLQQTSEAGGILNALIRQPVSGLADALIRTQSDPETFTAELSKITSDWGFQRRNLLLSHLANEGAISVLDSVIGLSPEAQREKQAIFRICAEIIHSSGAASPGSKPGRAIADFLASPTDRVALCLRRPLAETLFRRWPNDALPDLIPVVRKTALTDRSSINLQLAAILINRGRSDLAKELKKFTGSIPITFLAGSPWNILSPSEFNCTLAYLQDAEPHHVALFADNCIRNAVASSSTSAVHSRQATSALASGSTDRLVDLVRGVTQPPAQLSLAGVCLLPTLNLISEYLAGHSGELPSDVEHLLRTAASASQRARTRTVSPAPGASSRTPGTRSVVKGEKRSAN